jgi:hypothetical protein
MILSKTLGMEKVRAKAVPKNPTTDQLQQMWEVWADLQRIGENDQSHNWGCEQY